MFYSHHGRKHQFSVNLVSDYRTHNCFLLKSYTAGVELERAIAHQNAPHSGDQCRDPRREPNGGQRSYGAAAEIETIDLIDKIALLVGQVI